MLRPAVSSNPEFNNSVEHCLSGSRRDPRRPHRFSLFLYKNVYYQFGKFPSKFRISEIDRRFVRTKILQPMQTRNLYELVTPNLGPKKGINSNLKIHAKW